MLSFGLEEEAEFDPRKHVENILGKVESGDVTIACWEPGQVSPNHCHPYATEIYFCYVGGGVMKTPGDLVEVKPGFFIVHSPGEVHEYANGPSRTLLFRVRYDSDMAARHRNGLAIRTGILLQMIFLIIRKIRLTESGFRAAGQNSQRQKPSTAGVLFA